jgi:hypothetical protein
MRTRRSRHEIKLLQELDAAIANASGVALAQLLKQKAQILGLGGSKTPDTLTAESEGGEKKPTFTPWPTELPTSSYVPEPMPKLERGADGRFHRTDHQCSCCAGRIS